MVKFDELRAMHEEMSGLMEIYRWVNDRSQRAQQAFIEAEAEYMQFNKLRGFVQGLIESKEQQIRALKNVE